MKLIFHYLRNWRWQVVVVVIMKFFATLLELLIPYVLEHLVDDVAPAQSLRQVFFWGGVMCVLAALVWLVNTLANRRAVRISAEATEVIRRDMFWHSLTLSGSQMDAFTLPSITSRMTVDSYNVQDFIRYFQSIGVRAPLMLLGGMVVTLFMDRGLGLILCIFAPVAAAVAVLTSLHGITLYDRVQRSVDDITRILRENITGIRVVKALSKETYETRRFGTVNNAAAQRETHASTVMALPGPTMTLLLNGGLTLVVLVGAMRVNSGETQPGVILAFLTYFNMILTSMNGLSRVFLVISKSSASARRIAAVIGTEDALPTLPQAEPCHTDGFVVFDDVSFRYGAETTQGGSFAGEAPQMSLEHISFSIRRGGSLGIIGPTGCGKTTILNLLMRFYDPQQGTVFLDGQDVRTYDKDDLRRRFGVVFQNDVIFADSLAENIRFGRTVEDDGVRAAAEDACAMDFIGEYEDGFAHYAAIHGANLSGGQRQRVLIARALAAQPEILLLDDASSALDYRTDAALRQAIRTHHSGATSIVVAQRVSSILHMDEILVMDAGRIIGRGTHTELLQSCPQYQEIYRTQMGEAV